jgi:hypothetical protein
LVRARRAEDINAAAVVGAKTLHFDFLDCIYRRGKNGNWLYPLEVFVPPHEDESDLPARIADAIAARLHPDDKLICQFAIGSHVDHVTVRRAVELLQHSKVYDADIPYLFNSPNELTQKIIGMNETLHSIGDPALESWQNGIAQYKSQLSGLFDSDEDMRAKIKQYVVENNGVKLWASI